MQRRVRIFCEAAKTMCGKVETRPFQRAKLICRPNCGDLQSLWHACYRSDARSETGTIDGRTHELAGLVATAPTYKRRSWADRLLRVELRMSRPRVATPPPAVSCGSDRPAH